MTSSVLCVGNAVQDQIFLVDEIPTAPLKTYVQDYIEVGGGPAANAAAAIARLGGRSALWARVGEDAVGRRVIDDLASWGVETGNVRTFAERRTIISAVVIDRAGERLILAFADKSPDVSLDWLPLDSIGNYDALLCDVRWPDAAEIALSRAAAAGIPSILDADLTVDAASARLLPLASHAVFSEPALLELTGRDDPETALRAASERTPGHVSVTLGSQGYAFLEDGKFRHIPGFKVEVKDTLAAGDVFHGAFALAIAEGRDLYDAGRFASAVASIKCTRLGGRLGTPTRDEVEEFLSQPRS